jgi:hypothetical protein
MELPKNGDKLFKPELSFDTGAWLANPANKFFLYSEGYKNAGDALHKFCLENPFYNNTIIYPLVFTYRQFVELRLKELILMGNKLNDSIEDFPDEHNILKLWKIFRNVIYPKIAAEDKDLLDNSEKIIEQFTTEDSQSMNFRYPLTGGAIRRDTLKRETIDLVNLKNVIDKLYNLLSNLWMELSQYEDMKQEMIQEYFSERWH